MNSEYKKVLKLQSIAKPISPPHNVLILNSMFKFLRIKLINDTARATNNKPLAANSSGLVFSHADKGVALTATTAAALFSNTQAVGEYDIAKGSGIELLIETGTTPTTIISSGKLRIPQGFLQPLN
jgi:hypothetical protein